MASPTIQKVPEQRKGKVLVIAYFFPPTGGVASAAAQRTLKFVRYMPKFGWEPLVLTARADCYESYIDLDETLLEKVPEDLVIYRSNVMRGMSFLLRLRRKLLDSISSNKKPAVEVEKETQPTSNASNPVRISRYQSFKDFITDLFQIPDEQVGWLIPGVLKGRKISKKEGFDIIFATGKPWTGLMIGLILSFLTRRPLITELQDPWTTNPFKPKYSFIKSWFDRHLERLVIKRSCSVITTTNELKEEFSKRFSDEPEDKFLYLSNCYDPADIPEILPDKYSSNIFTILHLGFLYVKRDPRNFLLGLRIALDEGWVEAERIKFLQVGTVDSDFNLEFFIQENKLQDVVQLYGQVPLKESLALLWEAHCLLLLQPGTTTQTPSKLFEYIITGQPILTISPKDGAVWKFASENNLGKASNPDDPREIAEAIRQLYAAWRDNKSSMRLSQEVVERYSAIPITAELVKRMEADAGVSISGGSVSL